MGDECRFDEPRRTLTVIGINEPIRALAQQRLGITDTEAKWLEAKGWLIFGDDTPVGYERTFHLRHTSTGVTGYLKAWRNLAQHESKYGVRWEGEGGDTVAHLLDQFHAQTSGGPVPGFSGVVFSEDDMKLTSDFVSPEGLHVHTVSTIEPPIHLEPLREEDALKDFLNQPLREWGDPELFKHIHDLEERSTGLVGPEACRAEILAGRAPIGVDSHTGDLVFDLRGYNSEERKAVPIHAFMTGYFPDALWALARLSKKANDKHNPGEVMHWARSKSADQLECATRHLFTPFVEDPETGEIELAAAVWRGMAELQLYEEKRLKKAGIIPLSEANHG